MRWGTGLVVGAIAAIVGALLVSATLSAFGPRVRAFPVAVPLPADAQPVTVVQVLAGDTVIVMVERPGPYFPVAREITAHLIGVDAPDFGLIDECFAQDSEAKLTAYLPEGSIAWLKTDVDEKDDLGRWLTYAWSSDGLFLNLALAGDGYVRAEPTPPNLTLYPEIERAGQNAASRFAGLWGRCR